MSRNARFVAAAKRLLAMQVAASLGAAAVTIWAAFEVRALVAERDSLAARVARLEAAIPPAMLPLVQSEAPDAGPAEPIGAVARPGDAAQAAAGAGTVTANGSGGTGPVGGSGGGPVVDESAGTGNAAGTGGGEPVTNDTAGQGGGEVVAEEPRRDCRRVDGRAVVCVPPFRTTPVRGVCVDGRARPVRCPPGVVREPEPPRETEEQQSPTGRR